MNSIENCAAVCPIVQGLPEEIKSELLNQHRRECAERRLGQLGMLCGIPDAEGKNSLTRAALAASRAEQLITV